MAIGDYDTRLVLMRRDDGKDSEYGGRQKSFADAGLLWASVEETTAGKRRQYLQIETRADAVIRVRGLPSISSHDRLRVKSSGQVYRLEGVRIGDNELVCEAYRLPEGVA